MTINREVADFAVRDPFATPVPERLAAAVIGTDRMQRIAAAMNRLCPGEQGTVILSYRASTPRAVIDAKASESCRVCGELVWISPSTARTPHAGVVCMTCVGEAA